MRPPREGPALSLARSTGEGTGLQNLFPCEAGEGQEEGGRRARGGGAAPCSCPV